MGRKQVYHQRHDDRGQEATPDRPRVVVPARRAGISAAGEAVGRQKDHQAIDENPERRHEQGRAANEELGQNSIYPKQEKHGAWAESVSGQQPGPDHEHGRNDNDAVPDNHLEIVA